VGKTREREGIRNLEGRKKTGISIILQAGRRQKEWEKYSLPKELLGAIRGTIGILLDPNKKKERKLERQTANHGVRRSKRIIVRIEEERK